MAAPSNHHPQHPQQQQQARQQSHVRPAAIYNPAPAPAPAPAGPNMNASFQDMLFPGPSHSRPHLPAQPPPTELSTPAFSSHSGVSPGMSSDTSGRPSSQPQVANRPEVQYGSLQESTYPHMGIDVSSFLTAFNTPPTEEPQRTTQPTQPMVDPFAYAAVMQPQAPPAPNNFSPQPQQPLPVTTSNPWAQNIVGTSSSSSASTPSHVPPFSASSPFCYAPAFKPGMDDQGNAAGVMPSNLTQLLPFGGQQYANQGVQPPLNPPTQPTPVPMSLPTSSEGSLSAQPTVFWNTSNNQTPIMPPLSLTFNPDVPWRTSVKREKAASPSPPPSGEYTHDTLAPLSQRLDKRASASGSMLGATGAGPPNAASNRRSRPRATTLDGTPRDLALKHRLSNQALNEEDPSKRIKSETSLAHKLTVHAQNLVQQLDQSSDPTSWGILQPGAYDSVSSVMMQLHMIQQARLMRQANAPITVPKAEPQENATPKTRRRRRKLSDGEDSRVPHNAIERRYRNNINDRIATLRNAVPALRNLTPKNNGGSTSLVPRKPRKQGEPEDMVDGVSAATKLNKATILGKATEYIHHLKKRETQLTSEVEGLKEVIRALRGGEDLLLVWMHEMEQARIEREAEEARLEALKPIKEEGVHDEMDDLVLSDDEEDDHQPSGTGSAPRTGSYAMAAFLGFTLLGTNPELHHPMASHPGARALSASHQLWKRSVPFAATAGKKHAYDSVGTDSLVVEVVRFLTFLACALFTLYPLYRTWVSQSSSLPPERPTCSQRLAMQRHRAKLNSRLTQPHTGPVAVDDALRVFAGAPRTRPSAILRVVSDLVQWVRGSIRSPGLDTGHVPPPSLATTQSRAEADMWIRLLDLETAWGPFAQRGLVRKAHTVLKVSLIAQALDETEHLRLHPKQDELDEEQEDDYLVERDSTPARVHALLALALGRAGSPTHAVGMLARKYAHMHWDRARALHHDEEWFAEVLSGELEDALALLPSEAEASAAAAAAAADMQSLRFLGSPLLLVTNATHMACLYSIWSTLFPHLITSASPTTFSARVRREREYALTLAPLEGEAKSQLPSEQAHAPGGGVDVNAFLREFFTRVHRGMIKVDLLSSNAQATKELRSAIQDLLDHVAEQRVDNTPANYLVHITLATWSFLNADPSTAQQRALPLLNAVQSGSPMLGARPAALACLELLGLVPKQDSEVDQAAGLSDDRAIFALVTSGLQWLLFLRSLGLNRSLFQYASPDTHKVSSTLLAQAFTLRKTLARASSPYLRANVPSLGGTQRTAHRVGAEPLWADRIELSLVDAQDGAIDVLTVLCRFLGRRTHGGEWSALMLRPAPSSSGGESDLVWIPEGSD